MLNRIIGLALLIAPFLAATAGSAEAAPSEGCRPPRYQVVKTDWDHDSSDGVHKAIVIALRDFAPERLLCLVESLEGRYKRPDYVSILIFSSAKAAQKCNPILSSIEWEGGINCPQLHANYEFNARTYQRYIRMLPTGGDDWQGPEERVVDLPAETLRPCGLELDHRCILELNYLEYPDDTLAALVSGAVTVTGTIGRQGRATAIEVLKAEAHDVHGPKVADVLIRTVIEDVRSWRLEELARETAFRITFEFEVTDDLPQLSLEFQLPTRVIIRGKPSLLKIQTLSGGVLGPDVAASPSCPRFVRESFPNGHDNSQVVWPTHPINIGVNWGGLLALPG
jgi:hypothetical protein